MWLGCLKRSFLSPRVAAVLNNQMAHFKEKTVQFHTCHLEHFQYPCAIGLRCFLPLGAAVTVFLHPAPGLTNCEQTKLLPRGANLVTDQSCAAEMSTKEERARRHDEPLGATRHTRGTGRVNRPDE